VKHAATREVAPVSDGNGTKLVPTLARLGEAIAADRALDLLARKQLRARRKPIVPSGMDALACEVALQTLTTTVTSLAVAVPRGRTGLPALLGLYLVFQRWGRPQLRGSVLVATARGELSDSLRGLTLEGSLFEHMQIGKLVSRPVASAGTARPPARQAMMRSLDRRDLSRLSAAQGNLMFARLGAIPPPVPGVIGFAVVDTVGAARPAPGRLADPDSPDPWTLTYTTLLQAGSAQLWVGELGDPQFEAFCRARRIPVIRITWPLIAAAATLSPFGCGGELLSSRGVCECARARHPLVYQLVHDAQRDELTREAYTLMGMIRRRGDDMESPEPLHTAYRLTALITRLACPLDTYERAAAVGSPVFNLSARAMLADVERASRAAFSGRWADAYDRYWHTLVGVMRRLAKYAEGEPAKLHALFDVIVAARSARKTVVIRCQTETERRALRDTLQELDADTNVEVVTYKRRAAAGPADAGRRTVLLSPPPPWQAATLLSAEEGSLEALVYAYELPKLRQAIADTMSAFDDDRANTAALDTLRMPPVTNGTWRPPASELLVERAAFGKEEEWENTEATVPIPDRGQEDLWRELVDLWGSDLPESASGSGALGDVITDYDGFARLALFSNAPPVLLRDDRLVDVIADADGDGLDDVISKSPSELSAGEHIAFLPGTEHHSLREALMSAWDDTLATERQLFEPLWRSAIEGAVAHNGVGALAVSLQRHEATVRSWYEDRAAPQQPDDFLAVLTASKNPAAWKARAPIWRFLQTTRTMHRIIGKKLRGAIAEAISDAPDQPNIRKLERLTAAPVGDLLDAAEELVIVSVSPAIEVSLAECGRYLPPDHFLLKGIS
jgi:hypothetical protein